MTTIFGLRFDSFIALLFGVGVLIGLTVEALGKWRKVWSIPALLVYATIGGWYFGDLIYYGMEDFELQYGSDLTQLALWQVVLFLISFRIFIRLLLPHEDDPKADHEVGSSFSQVALSRFFYLLLVGWAALFVVGLYRAEWDVMAILWPPTSTEKVSMFSTPGLGAGADFLVSTANYIYILICALLGVVFVLAKGPVRLSAFALMVVSWPYFWFDRVRNVMLAILLPGVFCYWIATRKGLWQKLAVSAILFGFINIWFLQVMRYRSAADPKIEDLLDFSSDTESQQHLGLDMLSELCWMNFLRKAGIYSPPLGARYFAEVAQVVPRTIWPGKPMVGIDYANARGFGARNESDETANRAGVYATAATGVIGQGVANFGEVFGVIAAAFLMALWTKVLSHLWRRRFELLRFLLFAVGCGLTFNMGRDITLLVLWPFAFGYIFVLLIERSQLDRKPVTTAQKGFVLSRGEGAIPVRH
jgi:hypothetical protein